MVGMGLPAKTMIKYLDRIIIILLLGFIAYLLISHKPQKEIIEKEATITELKVDTLIFEKEIPETVYIKQPRWWEKGWKYEDKNIKIEGLGEKLKYQIKAYKKYRYSIDLGVDSDSYIGLGLSYKHIRGEIGYRPQDKKFRIGIGIKIDIK
jgi:hypothetical protein